jgi:ABC-type xylose transport system permease subunit
MLMLNGFNIVLGALLLAAAIPYTRRIRHPQQKPLAAYLIFVSAFAVTAAVIFNLVVLLASVVKLGLAHGGILPSLLFFVLVFVPAAYVATRLASLPPWRAEPPP